jgi:RES domain
MRKIRNPQLLDRLQNIAPHPFQGSVWRLARAGRNPLLATNPKGRWDDGSFDVLYTALEPDTARAEVHYHLTRMQPVFPSALQVHLYELKADLDKVLAFKTLDDLLPFGVDPALYGTIQKRNKLARLRNSSARTRSSFRRPAGPAKIWWCF